MGATTRARRGAAGRGTARRDSLHSTARQPARRRTPCGTLAAARAVSALAARSAPAERPEVQQHDLATQLAGQLERRRVQPVQPGRELGHLLHAAALLHVCNRREGAVRRAGGWPPAEGGTGKLRAQGACRCRRPWACCAVKARPSCQAKLRASQLPTSLNNAAQHDGHGAEERRWRQQQQCRRRRRSGAGTARQAPAM